MQSDGMFSCRPFLRNCHYRSRILLKHYGTVLLCSARRRLHPIRWSTWYGSSKQTDWRREFQAPFSPRRPLSYSRPRRLSNSLAAVRFSRCPHDLHGPAMICKTSSCRPAVCTSLVTRLFKPSPSAVRSSLLMALVADPRTRERF